MPILATAWLLASIVPTLTALAFEGPLLLPRVTEFPRTLPGPTPLPHVVNPDPNLPWDPEKAFEEPTLAQGESDAKKAFDEGRITKPEYDEFLELHRRYTEICKKNLEKVRTEMERGDKCDLLKLLKAREDECISLREAALPIYKKIDPRDTGHELYLKERRRARGKIQQWLWNLACET